MNQVEELKEVLACGLSPNPCNSFGESLIHTVSRCGKHQVLQVFIDNGCSLQVSDDYGRTPLHDACWAAEPAFETVELIMKADRRLFFMIDARSHLPLAYVRREHWDAWIGFLNKIGFV